MKKALAILIASVFVAGSALAQANAAGAWCWRSGWCWWCWCGWCDGRSGRWDDGGHDCRCSGGNCGGGCDSFFQRQQQQPDRHRTTTAP